MNILPELSEGLDMLLTQLVKRYFITNKLKFQVQISETIPFLLTTNNNEFFFHISSMPIRSLQKFICD